MSVRTPRPVPVVALVIGALLAALALVASGPGTGLPSAVPEVAAATKDKDCSDFKNQRKAQKFFKKHKPKKDPHGLDADHDGIACESNPCPCKKRPAFRLAGAERSMREGDA